MKMAMLAAALAAIVLPAVPACADPPPWAPAHGYRDHDRYDHHRAYTPYRHGYHRERRLYRHDLIWRGRDGRYYCRRSDGTTGLVIGMAVGGVLGNSLADGRDRTFATILGMAGGGMLGHAIDRGNIRCR